jgi:hypothetical protein
VAIGVIWAEIWNEAIWNTAIWAQVDTDTEPDAFSFTDVTGAVLSTVYTSAAITVGGIDAAAAITVTGGTYDINASGAFTSDAGTVENGDTVRARGTSSGSYETAVNVAVTIGGVSDTFTITTQAEPGESGTNAQVRLGGMMIFG